MIPTNGSISLRHWPNLSTVANTTTDEGSLQGYYFVGKSPAADDNQFPACSLEGAAGRRVMKNGQRGIWASVLFFRPIDRPTNLHCTGAGGGQAEAFDDKSALGRRGPNQPRHSKPWTVLTLSLS